MTKEERQNERKKKKAGKGKSFDTMYGEQQKFDFDFYL